VTIQTPAGKTIRLWIGSPKAEVDGKTVLIDPENPEKIVPYIKDGRTKLPMRFVGEQLDAGIEWIPASRTVVLTVQDTFTCGCKWQEGCIVQWTEAPNNLYQVSFVLNCDKKSTLERYFIEKNLKSMTEGADLTEYLKKYPKPPYPTTKICVNQSKKIIKWDPIVSPGTNPPPSDPPPPPDPDPPEKKGQIIIQVPKELYYGTVIQIMETISEDKKIYAVNTNGTCYTGCELICGKTYVVTPINQKITFVPPSQTVTLQKCCPIEYEEVKFEGKESASCDYALSQLNESISSMPAGESYSIMFSLKNNCPMDTKDISFTLASLSGVMTITPNQFILKPGQKLPFKVFITMPSDCQNNSLVEFSFRIGTDCGIEKEHKFFVNCKVPEPPPVPSREWFCGCFSKFNAESAEGTKIWLNNTCKEPESNWKVCMIPKDLKDVKMGLLISEYIANYPLKKYKYLCVELFVDEKGVVLKWKANPEQYPDCCQPKPKKGLIIGNISGTCNPGVTVNVYEAVTRKIVWTGKTDSKGNYETSDLNNCILDCPGTYQIVPSKDKYAFIEPNQTVTFTDNDCCDGNPMKVKAQIANFKGVTTAEPGKIIANLCRDCHGATVTFQNLSNPAAEIVTKVANIKSTCSTECTQVYGDTYRVTPKKDGFRFTPEFIDVKIEISCPDGFNRVSFDAQPIQTTQRNRSFVLWLLHQLQRVRNEYLHLFAIPVDLAPKVFSHKA